MNKFKFCAISLFSVFFISSSQASSNVCQFDSFIINRTQIQTGVFQSGVCYLNLSDTKSVDLVYRTHLFTDEGLQMVFNSYGYGPSSTHTGARMYFHPGPQKYLDLNFMGPYLEIQLSTGNRLLFDTNNFKFLAQSDIKYTEDLRVNRSNQGGLLITSSPTAYLDFGFSLGGSPMMNMNGSFFYISPGKAYCGLRNNFVLKRVNGDVEWKYSPYGELEGKIMRECGHE